MEAPKNTVENKDQNTEVDSNKDAVIAYPYKSFESILSFVGKIYSELGHDIYHTREQIAKLNNLAPNSIKQPISTAQQFGLLEIKHGVGYKTTDLYARISLPSSEEERRLSILESLRSSNLYNELLGVYEKSGILPNNTGLANTLHRQYKFDLPLSQRIAREFVNTLKMYDFLDDKNILRLNRGRSLSTESIPTPVQIQSNNEASTTESQPKANENNISITIPLKGKRTATLIVPSEFDDKDIDRISKFVDALKEGE